MVNQKLTAGLLLLSLAGCGGGGGVAVSVSPEEDTWTGTELPEITSLDDPLLSYQWYLNNTAQLADSPSAGTAYEDMHGFSGGIYARNYTGRGIKIALIDTGLEIAHEDLSTNVLPNGSFNFVTGTTDPTSTLTSGDHGTAVAGLAGARGGNGIGISGVAPSAYLQGFNLLSSSGEITKELAALGYESARVNFANLTSHWTDIFSRSYGNNQDIVNPVNSSDYLYTESVLDGIQSGTEQLRDGKGALYIKAVGNEYNGGSAFSSSWCAEAAAHQVTCYNANQETENATPFQIVVGAFNASGVRSDYSNTGSALWISAAGGQYGDDAPALMTTDQSGCRSGYSQSYRYRVDVDTAFNLGFSGSGNESCNYYSAFNGTSAATPLVSGVAALLLEAYPEAGWRDIKHFLAASARQIQPALAAKTLDINSTRVTIEQGWVTNQAGYHFSNEFGFGAVDVIAALDKALEWKNLGQKQPGLVEIESQNQVLSVNNEIPNFDATGISRTLSFTQTRTVETMELTLSIMGLDNNASGSTAHKIDASDYLIQLTSPSGTKSILMTPFNAYRSSYDMPNLRLVSHAFYGESLNGTWTLQVLDVDQNTQNAIQDVGKGKLTEWSLRAYAH
ncbi:S8 family serine peptidase [Thiosulfativibrio zosterae]|uniref:Peptidase S8 n=1 Tax=Thiosulfativibrio zosterae TaxID=2675053 RepID=A0A6F8PKV0_9GAMM|nr:S8 family serine peptidase [Thiosulfativibrio zosterae]BBP42677.1 peptidase S8 [Thiosulfativibrio zosterae]